jgi:tRNA U34 5-carboxymethylaminomethyl modifying enzyme MnmG/GidA
MREYLKEFNIECRCKDLAIKEAFAKKQLKKEENSELSKDMDYSDVSLCLGKESIEVLNKHRPLNVSFMISSL